MILNCQIIIKKNKPNKYKKKYYNNKSKLTKKNDYNKLAKIKINNIKYNVLVRGSCFMTAEETVSAETTYLKKDLKKRCEQRIYQDSRIYQ